MSNQTLEKMTDELFDNLMVNPSANSFASPAMDDLDDYLDAMSEDSHDDALLMASGAGRTRIPRLQSRRPRVPRLSASRSQGGSTCAGSAILDRFDYDRDTLREAHRAEIARLAGCVVSSHRTAQPISVIRITGHTDPAGPDWYNTQLGQRRAEQVRRHLVQAIEGSEPGLTRRIAFQVDSRGEREPIPGDAARSRRVEVSLVAPSLGTPPICPSPPTLSPDFNRWLQRTLRVVLGRSDLQVDGRFGPQTRGAVQSFQQRSNLPVSGTVDLATLQVLSASAGRKGAPPCTMVSKHNWRFYNSMNTSNPQNPLPMYLKTGQMVRVESNVKWEKSTLPQHATSYVVKLDVRTNKDWVNVATGDNSLAIDGTTYNSPGPDDQQWWPAIRRAGNHRIEIKLLPEQSRERHNRHVIAEVNIYIK